jgi:hypothetical protein
VQPTEQLADRATELESLRAQLTGAPQQAARRTLRAQIARLELELAEMLAGAFPHLSTDIYPRQAHSRPRLLTLAELELRRDWLVNRVAQARLLVAGRAEHERRSRELLERMKLEPGRYRSARVSVRDLGLGTCGVWEVRPRLGVIGRLAGWWQVKISSGCPLASGCVT